MWAVGTLWKTNSAGGAEEHPLAMRYNGDHWWRVAFPASITNTKTSLSSVVAISPTDVWAVGSPDTFAGPLVVHWDGSTWSKVTVPLPPADRRTPVMNAVDASSASNVWMVGYVGAGVFFDHWNGTSWTLVRLPQLVPSGDFLEPESIRVFSPTNVWVSTFDLAAGCCCGCHAELIHYNGTKWAAAQPPDPTGDADYDMGDLGGTAANLWSAGANGGVDEYQQLVYQHTPGGKWKAIMPFPNYNAQNPNRSAALSGVVAPTPTDVWAPGSWVNTANETCGGPLVAHYDGTTWTDMGVAHRTHCTYPAAITTVPGSRELWMVGAGDTGGPVIWYRSTS